MDNDGFWPFLGGLVVGIGLSILINCSGSNPETVQAFEKLCKAGVPITCSIHGNYYMWDEKTKSSYEISTTSVIIMSRNLK